MSANNESFEIRPVEGEMQKPMRLFFPLLLLSYVLTLLLGIAYTNFLGAVRIDEAYYLAPRNLVAMILVMPFMETVVLQWAVIEIFAALGDRKFLNKSWVVAAGVLASAMLFAWVHFEWNGHFNGVVFGIKGGILYATLYAALRGVGRSHAFVFAWWLHAASNALLMLSLAFFSRVVS